MIDGEINIKVRVNCIPIKSFVMSSWWNGKNWNSQSYISGLFASLDRANRWVKAVQLWCLCALSQAPGPLAVRAGATLRCFISLVVSGYGFSSVSLLFTNYISCNYMLLVALLTMLMSQIHWTFSCQINF